MSARLRLCFSLIGLVALPSLAAADGLYIPGISPDLPYPRPSYREAYNDFPPGRYGGGFIEFVMSGAQTSLHGPLYSQAGAAAYAAPAPAYVPMRRGAALPPSGLPEYAPQQPQAYYGAPQGAPPFNQPVAPIAYGAPGASYAATAADPRLVQPMNPIYARQVIAYAGDARPGTILIDTVNKFLYLVQPGAQAIRYGIGVGRPGFVWTGTKRISRKAEWPDWTPPREMLARRPDLPHHMEGGDANPLGARALYLGTSEYRIHGTNEPYTIGTNVSSGCIRMMNQDVIDLYNRVGVGTRVVVM